MATDPRKLLDDYATEEALPIGIRRTRERTAPKAFGALRAALDLHLPFKLTTSTFRPKPVGCGHCSEIPNFVD